MELIQLKVPPDKLTLIADALQRDIDARPAEQTSDDLLKVLVWLRYRHSRWMTRRAPRHPR